MIVVLDPERAGAHLAQGLCRAPAAGPRCARGASPGHAGSTTTARTYQRIRPARARCPHCHVTQVLPPADCQPRSGYSTGTIGQALLGHVQGRGHRPIAAALGPPATTVRDWLRKSRSGADTLDRHAATRLADLDRDVLAGLLQQSTRLADALQALAAAAHVALSRRLVPPQPTPWPLMAQLAGGRLITPARPT